RDVEVDPRHQTPVLIEYGYVGRADFLALDVEHRLRHRQNVGDFGRADHRGREWVGKTKRARFVERHLYGAHLLGHRVAWAALVRPSRSGGWDKAETSRGGAGGCEHRDPNQALR